MKPRLLKSASAMCVTTICFLTFCVVLTTSAQEQASECLNCHRDRNLNSNEGILNSQLFCYDCHKDPASHEAFRDSKVSLLVKPEYFKKSSHQFIACIQCHTNSARSPHRLSSGVKCLDCHADFFGNPGIHAGHIRVKCEACHTDSPFVQLDIPGNQVHLSHTNDKQLPISLAEHKNTNVTNEEFCARCHNSDNQVGAPTMILPSKSFVCIACHYSPLRIGNPIFLVAIIIAFIGIVGTLAFWFRAGVQSEVSSAHRKLQLGSEVVWSKIFSKEFFSIMNTILFDVILQRRILANGVSRWVIHSLIFYSFFARFALSTFTLILQRVSPGSELAMTLVNRDSPFVASFNDITGVFILIGVAWAMFRRYVTRPEYVLTQEQDTVALIIIGLVTLTGFLVEGVRILIAQIPAHIAFPAFAGYFISKCLSIINIHWQSVFGYLWYLHALLWALFIAYLPFGKLKHIVTTPLSLLLNYKKE